MLKKMPKQLKCYKLISANISHVFVNDVHKYYE